MKKLLAGFAFCLFIITASLFAQAVDRSLFSAVDPFDYRLDEDRADRGAVRRFRSVVQYESESRVGNNTIFLFSSLDNSTKLDARAARGMAAPSPGQIVTIYFTATKRVGDTRVLDEIDLSNTTENGIGVVKSAIAVPPGLNRAEYEDIDPFDYISDTLFIAEGEVRKYRTNLQFSSQDGTTFFFASLDPEQTTRLRMRARRRFLPMTEGQRVTVYFTAEMGFLDSLTIDYIDT